MASFADGVFRAFDIPKGSPGSALGNPATVHAGRHGIWLNTPRAVFRFQGSGWVEVARESPVTGAFMSTIIEDGHGQIWTGVSSGVVRVSSSGAADVPPSLRVFDESAGLVGTVGGKPDGWPAAARSADGRLWFATSRGLAVIDPARLGAPGTTRAPRIDRVIADSREFQGGSHVDVPPGSTKIEIHYGALDLSNPQSVRFRYVLDGSDTGWVDAGARREAFYTNLPPRAYTFRVDVNDENGRWTGTPAQITLNVQPTFLQTIWFYVAVGCVGLSVVGAAWWLRLRVVRSRFASILAERARVAREIHDTLLQDLGSVAVELEVVTNELAGAPQPAVDTLRQLRRRVTECVREARDSIEQLRSTSNEERNLVGALNDLAKSFSNGKNLACSVSIAGSDHRRCTPEVEKQLLRISHEAVSNSVRHSHASRIRIELEYQKEAILLCVADDGCGFDPQDPVHHAPGHWGIASMRERAAAVGGSFHIASRVGGGTQVEVVLPCHAHSDGP